MFVEKPMLCIWSDQLGVVDYELLKSNETIAGGPLSNTTDDTESSNQSKRAPTTGKTKLFSLKIMLMQLSIKKS